MKIYKKIFPSLIACLLLTSCAGVSENSGPVGDVFSASEENTGNPFLTSDAQGTTAIEQYQTGGWSHKINDNKPVVYDGKPVTVKASITMQEENSIDWTAGICCNINGVYQKLSGCGQDDVTMVIIDGLAPGETREVELTFDPMVREEDVNKDQVKMSFLTCINPDYIASEDWPSFGYVRTLNWSLPDSIEFKAKPKTVSPVISDEYTEELITDEAIKKHFAQTAYDPDKSYINTYQEDGPNGPLELSADGSLSFDFLMINLDPGTYMVSVLNNNQLATFNGGKEYAEVTVKKEHLYSIPISLDEAQRGDVINCVAVKKNYTGMNTMAVKSDSARLVVKNGFELSTEEPASIPETAALENSEPEISEPENTDPGALPILQNCRLFGYYEQDGSRIALLSDVFGDDMYFYDADKEKVIKKVNAWDIGKCNFYGMFWTYDPSTGGRKELEYIENESVGYDAMQITDKYFIVPDATYDYLVYDRDFKLVKKITNKEEHVEFYFTDDDKHIIKKQVSPGQNGERNIFTKLYISDLDGKNSKELCALPENMNIGSTLKYTAIRDGMLYSLMEDNSALNSKYTPTAIDLSTGEIITADFTVETAGTGSQGIYCAKDYVLYVTGNVVMDNNDSGAITIFDKKQNKFRQIKTANINESHSCTITPDGSKIIAVSPKFDLSEKQTADTTIRIYDTATGENVNTVDNVPDLIEAAIICGNEKLMLPGERENSVYDIG